jgi:methionyl-tRNA formyltransferase
VKDISIFFLGKKNDAHCLKALNFIKKNVKEVTVYNSEWGQRLPEDIGWWKGDYIISYLSRWVISEHLIGRATKGAINFHPGSLKYPGIGCNNFALYNNEVVYGVTCHNIAKKVDTGSIVMTKEFPVFKSDNVETLLDRTYDFQLILFYEVLGIILNDNTLPISNKKWLRKPYTRTEFNKLSIATKDMDSDEILRIIRATSYKEFKPYIMVDKFKFEIVELS